MDSSSARYDCINRTSKLYCSRVSLTVNVRQALKAQDIHKLSIDLFKADMKTVAATAKEVTGQEATEILDVIAKIVTTDPSRLRACLDWIRELVLAHAAFLSSQASMKLRLKPILDVLNQRVADHSDLIHMRQVTDALLKNAKTGSVDVSTPTGSFNSEEPLIRINVE